MNCQRYKPAEFVYITPLGEQKEKLKKGVPQVDMSILEVSDTFHSPPAYSVSNDVIVNYPPDNVPVPDTTPRFYKSSELSVKPHNFVCMYQDVSQAHHKHNKTPMKSVRHPGQRMLA